MQTNSYHPDLLAEIAAFCEARGMSRSAFGMAALGDPALIPNIENGRELRRKTIEAIRRFMVTGQAHQRKRSAAA